MAEYLAPGVYVEEFSSGIKPMEGVSTSTVGFLGMTERGPVRGVPTFISSFGEFQRVFGGYLPESYGDRRFLPMAVEQFFANGGSRCFVVRLLKEEDAVCAKVRVDKFIFEAASPGAWGNGVSVQSTVNFNNTALLDLTISDGSGRGAYTETYSEISLDPAHKNYIVRALKKSLLLRAESVKPAPDENALRNDDAEQATAQNMLLKGSLMLTLSGGMDAGATRRLPSNAKAGMLGDSEKPEEAQTPEGTETSEEVQTPEGTDTPAEPQEADPVKGINAAVLKGDDGGAGNRTGLCALRDVPEVSIVVAPGVTDNAEVQEIITHCELMKNCVCILDLPFDKIKVKEIEEVRKQYSSAFAALYHPWIQVFDPMTASAVYMPPSGAIAGVYARTDNERGVHKAPANEPIRNCTGLSALFGKAEQEMLNPIGVNLIRNMPGLGIRIWGARTLSSDSEWKYVNVRRLFIYIEETIRRNTSWAVFEPNDQLLWTKVRGSIVSFLSTLWRNGALFGTLPEEAFFVNIGKGSTMTDDDILNGRLVCVIGVSPVRPAEFVIFRITQIMEQNG